jgi:glycerate 2-kinase
MCCSPAICRETEIMQPKSLQAMRRDARAIFEAGLVAVAPQTAIAAHCRREGRQLHVGPRRYDLSRYENIWIIGTGKASAAMAHTLEDMLGSRVTGGLITVKYGHLEPLRKVRIIEAGHPVPDENGCAGARKILAMAQAAGARDLVFCLISGGGSALLPIPDEGLTLADKQEASRVLLSCGASIREMNAVRKHLSAIKGGRLAAAVYPADLCTLILSDVVGDDLDVIASGPTVPDAATFQDALGILERYDIRKRLPEAVVDHLERGAAGAIAESPKPDAKCFQRAYHLIVANNRHCIQAAREEALRRGYHTLVLSTLMEGETREVARVHGAIGREILATGQPLPPPACLISGGETTVTLKNAGRGGRNQEFALAAALDIDGSREVVILSGGTDGTDGPTDAAGAVADGHTAARARSLGMDPRQHLTGHDAYPLFERLGDLVRTGPTNTNVMDLRLVLVSGP